MKVWGFNVESLFEDVSKANQRNAQRSESLGCIINSSGVKCQFRNMDLVTHVASNYNA